MCVHQSVARHPEAPLKPETWAPSGGTSGVATDPPSAAAICGLRVSFPVRSGTIHALRGVDLQIEPGEILGLVGESGSGKTVLGLSLLGLLAPSARIDGTVHVDGVEMTRSDIRLRRAVRRRALGAVFQDPMSSLNPTMRIGAQVTEVAGDAKNALRLLGAVGIPEPESRLRSFPHELSGGLRQRVMLAIALANDPLLIVADEPTTALDVSVQAQVLELFARMRDEVGCAMLLITHDLGVASKIADRVCVLYGGLVSELGARNEILSEPAHPYTAALLRSRITLRADRSELLPVIPGEPPSPTGVPAGCNFADRCPAVVELCREKVPRLKPVSVHSGVAACHLEAGPTTVDVMTGAPWFAPVTPGLGGARVESVSVRFSQRRGLRKGPEIQALQKISLDVKAGETVALVGESGSGKTTLLRVLAGLQIPTSGKVMLKGDKRPQMVFQDAGASFTPWLTIGEHLEERVRDLPHEERIVRIDQTLHLLGLPPRAAEVRPLELSGGQRQRAALARAMIDPPELLLCDEPISALDASLAAMVLNLLGRLRRELGFALVFVTHDLAAARLVADRIAVMSRGCIVEIGSTEHVTEDPSDDYTRRLLEAVPEVSVWR